MDLDKLLRKRRSIRRFSTKAISQADITKLIKAAKKAPSAGGIRPVKIIIVEGDKTEAFWRACARQKVILNAPLIFVFCADFTRMERKYGKRGNRYILLEIGHMAQNVCLKAVELGLATCPVGAFKDKKIKVILGCEESPLYMLAIGKQK